MILSYNKYCFKATCIVCFFYNSMYNFYHTVNKYTVSIISVKFMENNVSEQIYLAP